MTMPSRHSCSCCAFTADILLAFCQLHGIRAIHSPRYAPEAAPVSAGA